MERLGSPYASDDDETTSKDDAHQRSSAKRVAYDERKWAVRNDKFKRSYYDASNNYYYYQLYPWNRDSYLAPGSCGKSENTRCLANCYFRGDNHHDSRGNHGEIKSTLP